MTELSPTPAPPRDSPPPAAGVAPLVADAPVVKKTERPHPVTPFIRGWLVLVAIIVGFGRDLLPSGDRADRFDSSDLRWILPVAAGVVVLAAVAGFISWYFTRFVIDDEELRIETGAIFKTSKKVPFERLQSIDIIQPFAARIFGLAELRLEAGAGDSTIKLRYLTRAKAGRLRDYLIARAHGDRTSINDPGAEASKLTDLGATDRPLVTVSPQRLVVGFVLSSEWLVTATIAIVVLAVTIRLDVVSYALPGLIPLAIGAVTMISRRVIAMFHFTLAESARGLRVTRGLTNLTSQSVPIDRIQGLKVSQSILWRRLDWYRIDVDIVGYGSGDGENNESDATSVLLPVADAQQVQLALSRVLPGVDLDSIELQNSPRRARWLRWYDFWTLRYGWNDRVVITEEGWLTRVRNIVPHAKTQSVRIEQGPLQRGQQFADVHFDTPKGPVNAVARRVDAHAARDLALGQLNRARAARQADRERVSVATVDDEASAAAVLTRFGIGADRLLGAGGESRVFALGDDHVLRLYRQTSESTRRTVAQLRALYQSWAGIPTQLELPEILESGELTGRIYTVDRRMSGRSFSGWLAEAAAAERHPALLSYLDAVTAIPQLPAPAGGFARLIGADAPRLYASLGELLHDQLVGAVKLSRARLDQDLPEVAAVWSRLHDDLGQRQCAPALVHGDLAVSNAYVGRDLQGRTLVTGIGDFSPHTLVADPMMDLAGAICFLELEGYDGVAEDALWLGGQAAMRFGADVPHWVDVYRRYYGFYFSSAYEFDPALYAWCLRQLRR